MAVKARRQAVLVGPCASTTCTTSTCDPPPGCRPSSRCRSRTAPSARRTGRSQCSRSQPRSHWASQRSGYRS
eukprot:scaffold25276_cov72-Phaeocystis_antarctica.AAC.2